MMDTKPLEVLILIRKDIPQYQINTDTKLQVTAIDTNQ